MTLEFRFEVVVDRFEYAQLCESDRGFIRVYLLMRVVAVVPASRRLCVGRTAVSGTQGLAEEAVWTRQRVAHLSQTG